MRHLAYDMQRCRDGECPKRRECMRFISRDVVDALTPFAETCFNGNDRLLFLQARMMDIFGEYDGNAR